MASVARGGMRVPSNPALQGKRVIICDDHPTTRLALRSICQELGCDMRETGLGADAIELGESYDPDLLVLDHMLPDLDGLAVYQALRAQGIRTKVLVYTTYTRSRRFGDGITQPDGPDAALDKVASVFPIRTARVQVLPTDTKYIPERLGSREPSSAPWLLPTSALRLPPSADPTAYPATVIQLVDGWTTDP